MPSPRLEIRYCRRCRFLLRAAWLAQELLTTFEGDLKEVALIPSSGGIFEVILDGQTLFSNRQAGRFPELREIRRLVRDRIAPDRRLSHEATS